MNIQIKPTSNFIQFKSKIQDDENVLGFDDDISRENRNFIREHYYQYKMPYQSIYENEGRKSDYQMDALLKTLINKPRKVDDDSIMAGVKAYNLHSIGNNSYRGSTLSNSPSSLKALKKAGIKTVINLASYGGYKDKVEDAGLDYFRFNMKTSDDPFSLSQNIWSHSVFQNGERNNDRKFIDHFVEFIQTMQKGYCYIGCEFGTKDTSDALLLYNVFSPKADNKKTSFDDKRQLEKVEVLYSKLNDNDKKLMGWTEDFDKSVSSKLKTAKEEFLEKEEEETREWLESRYSKEEIEEMQRLQEELGIK